MRPDPVYERCSPALLPNLRPVAQGPVPIEDAHQGLGYGRPPPTRRVALGLVPVAGACMLGAHWGLGRTLDGRVRGTPGDTVLPGAPSSGHRHQLARHIFAPISQCLGVGAQAAPGVASGISRSAEPMWIRGGPSRGDARFVQPCGRSCTSRADNAALRHAMGPADGSASPGRKSMRWRNAGRIVKLPRSADRPMRSDCARPCATEACGQSGQQHSSALTSRPRSSVPHRSFPIDHGR